MFNQNRADQEPWRAAGVDAINMLRFGIEPDGDLVRRFGMSDYKADPGYGFRLSEGFEGIKRLAASQGNLLSGGVLQALTRYGQDMASNEWDRANKRFNEDQGNRYNRLAGVAGTGQSAVNQIGAQGMSMAQNVGGTMQGMGNARASGYIGQANALQGGLTGAYNNYIGQNMLNAYQDRTRTMNGSGVGGYVPYGGAGIGAFGELDGF